MPLVFDILRKAVIRNNENTNKKNTTNKQTNTDTLKAEEKAKYFIRFSEEILIEKKWFSFVLKRQMLSAF